MEDNNHHKHVETTKPKRGKKINICNNKIIMKNCQKEQQAQKKFIPAADIINLTYDEAAKVLDLNDYLTDMKLKVKYKKMKKYTFTEDGINEETIETLHSDTDSDSEYNPKEGQEEQEIEEIQGGPPKSGSIEI